VQNFRRGFAYTAWAILENDALRPYLIGGEKFQREQANAFFNNNECLRASGHIYENPLICDEAEG
jgi:hypothetical protein